jgi:hypothetical protein
MAYGAHELCDTCQPATDGDDPPLSARMWRSPR